MVFAPYSPPRNAPAVAAVPAAVAAVPSPARMVGAAAVRAAVIPARSCGSGAGAPRVEESRLPSTRAKAMHSCNTGGSPDFYTPG